MEHRIQFSTALLIAVRSEKKKTTNINARPSGIKIDVNRFAGTEKGLHSVDAEGNILNNVMQKDFAA